MEKVIIYHNPKCSKSRETLALLQQKGIAPEIVEYLKNPPKAETIQSIIEMLGGDPAILVRTKEEEFKANKFDLKDVHLVSKKLAEMPRLIERPIVLRGKRAVLGRPPGNVNRIL